MIEQILEPIGFGVLFLVTWFCYQARRNQRLMNASWKRMHNEFLQHMEGGFGSIGWKASVSRKLMERLIPAINHAATFDSGSYHQLIRQFEKRIRA